MSLSPAMPRRAVLAMSKLLALSTLVCALAAGCAPRVEREVIRTTNESVVRGLDEGARIYTYTAPADGLFASSHYIVSKEGVVVFDTQFFPEYARALHEQIVKRTGAPVVRIFITHPHPDHYFGTAELIRLTRADVSSTVTTAEHISSQGPSKRTYWSNQLGPSRMPDTISVPTLTFTGTTPAGAGGVVLEIQEVSLNESANSLIAWAPQQQALITGDLVFNGSHLFLGEGHSDAWLRELEALKRYGATRIYPGHGAPGGPELIDWNIGYIQTIQRSIARFVKPGAVSLTAEQLETVRREVLAAYPALANPEFLDLTIPSEFARQAAARTR